MTYNRILFDTVKCSLSVKNSCLGTMTGGLETEMEMYRAFLRFSQRKISFRDWKRYKSCLLISPEMTFSGAFSNTYSQMTLSLSFQVERNFTEKGVSLYQLGNLKNVNPAGGAPAHQTAGEAEKAARAENNSRGLNLPRNYVARMCIFNEQIVSIAEQGCNMEAIRMDVQEVRRQFEPKSFGQDDNFTGDNVLDEFVNTRD